MKASDILNPDGVVVLHRAYLAALVFLVVRSVPEALLRQSSDTNGFRFWLIIAIVGLLIYFHAD